MAVGVPGGGRRGIVPLSRMVRRCAFRPAGRRHAVAFGVARRRRFPGLRHPRPGRAGTDCGGPRHATHAEHRAAWRSTAGHSARRLAAAGRLGAAVARHRDARRGSEPGRQPCLRQPCDARAGFTRDLRVPRCASGPTRLGGVGDAPGRRAGKPAVCVPRCPDTARHRALGAVQHAAVSAPGGLRHREPRLAGFGDPAPHAFVG